MSEQVSPLAGSDAPLMCPLKCHCATSVHRHGEPSSFVVQQDAVKKALSGEGMLKNAPFSPGASSFVSLQLVSAVSVSVLESAVTLAPHPVAILM